MTLSNCDEIEEIGVVKTDKILKTTKSKCDVCGIVNLVKVLRPTECKVLIYSRQGTYSAVQLEYRCNHRNKEKSCRAGFYHGYKTYNGDKIYEDGCLKNDILMISSNTGFAIDFLVEIASSIDIHSSTFEGLSKIYNRMHNRKLPYDVMQQRVELCRKRISDAFFLFSYLELAQRYQIKNYQIII